MNKLCAIVRDLAPLYVEGLTSEESNTFIEEHLAQCESCRREVAALRAPAPTPAADSAGPLKKIHRCLQRRQSLAILATALTVAILFILLGGFMTAPEYLPAEAAIVNVNHSTNSDRIQVIFSRQVADYRLDGPYEQEGTDVYSITAWTTPLYQLFDNSRHSASFWIECEGNQPLSVYYNANDGQEMQLLLGSSESAVGMIALPRLALNVYALLAAGLLLVILLLYLPLRKRHGKLWRQLVLIPICYLAAHFAIALVSPGTYSIARNFCLILLLAFAFYGAACLLGTFLGRIRKKAA